MGAIKSRMDERGTSMTDTSPLIKIKSALNRIKEERKALDIRLGIVTHTLVAKKLKHDQHTKREEAQKKKATHRQKENTSYEYDDLED